MKIFTPRPDIFTLSHCTPTFFPLQSRYHELMGSLDVLNIGQEEQSFLFRVVAAVLHIGNIRITVRVDPDDEGGEEHAAIDPVSDLQTAEAIAAVSELLEVEPMHLDRALCFKRLQVRERERERERESDTKKNTFSVSTHIHTAIYPSSHDTVHPVHPVHPVHSVNRTPSWRRNLRFAFTFPLALSSLPLASPRCGGR